MIRNIFVLICLLFSLTIMPIQAQEGKSITEMSPEDYVALQLPSLETLFENAKNNPVLEVFKGQEEIEKSLLKKEKRSWLKFFSVGAGYSYGKAGIYSSYSDVNTPIMNQYSGNARTNYNVGASVGFSIESLFDLGPSVKRQALRVKLNNQQKEQAYLDLKKEIIELYSTAITSLNVIKIKAEAVVYASAQYKIGENDFLNGITDTGELNTQKSTKVQAQLDYESTKKELNVALLKLELITNTKIFKNNIKR